MKSTLTLKIKRRSQAGWLCWLIIILPFLLGTLNDLLGLPWAIRYILDVAWVCLLLMLLVKWRMFRSVQLLSVWLILFLVCTLLAYIPQYQSGLYYLWGLRNNFRFYVAFFAFSSFLSLQDVDHYFSVFDKLFWINFAVSLFQFFALGYNRDHLGGLFGVQTGANAYTNVFFCIVFVKSIIFYLDKKEPFVQCFLKFAAAMVIAAMAELKFFFVEAILIIILAVLFTNFSWRKVSILLAGLGAIAVGAAFLVAIFPSFSGFLSWDWFWENATSSKGYTSSGDINRLNAIHVINERFLENGWARIFGLGLGNCETSSFPVLNTPFYEANAWLHYSWISYAFMYLECGWIGLIFYFGFFISLYFKILRMEKLCPPETKSYCRIARIMTVLCIVISIYNSSLRAESGYMVYYVLAIPFILSHKNKTALI